jgi:hypothetical protein
MGIATFGQRADKTLGHYTSPPQVDWPKRGFIGQSYATCLDLLLDRDDLEITYVGYVQLPQLRPPLFRGHWSLRFTSLQ